jgi:uncharacterized protein (DUF302 family)
MVRDTRYGMGVAVRGRFDEVLARATEALKGEGFGVLTTIDVKKTLKEKLGADFRSYVILGACNPPLAHRAFQAELEIGLLLPCNVVVYDRGDGTVAVSAMAPLAALGVVGDSPALQGIAAEADARLRRALASLEQPAGSKAGGATEARPKRS